MARNFVFRISKTARAVDPTRIGRRTIDPRTDIHNLNEVAVSIRGFVTFDPSIIRINWRRINMSPLVRAGNMVRYIAKRSIRDVSQWKRPRPSPAGTPPRSRRAPNKKAFGESRPFKMIYSLPNTAATSVMVGMVGFNPRRPVPGVHELGLSQRVRGVRVKKGTPGATRHRYTIKKRGKTRWKTRWVATRTLRYPLRPFMRPALAKAVPKLPFLWNKSLSS